MRPTLLLARRRYAAPPRCGAPTTRDDCGPASDFFADFPDGDSSGGGFGGGRNQGPTAWQFNSSSLTLGVAGDLAVKLTVKEAGTYHLYVRAAGQRELVPGCGEWQAGPDQLWHGLHGYAEGRRLYAEAGAVEIRLTAIKPRPMFNVLVLTKNASFTEDDLKALELPPEVKLLHEYKIAPSNIVKFGDVDGSGKYAILDILNNYSSIMYANDGHELWRWTAPPTSQGDPRGNEAAGVLWDFHHTGKDELAQWRETPDGKEWLVLADGLTGNVINRCRGRRRRCPTWTTTTAWRWRSSIRTRTGRIRCWCLRTRAAGLG